MTVLDQAARLRELVLRHGLGGLAARVVQPSAPWSESPMEEDRPEAGPEREEAQAGSPLEEGPEEARADEAPAEPGLPLTEVSSAQEEAPQPPPSCPEAAVGEPCLPSPEELRAGVDVGAAEGGAWLASMRPAKAARVVAIASGKGGVGKSHLSCNLALAIAQGGVRTLLVDGDLGMANVDVLLGLGGRRHLGELLDGQASLSEVLLGHREGLQVVPGASGLAELADLPPEQLAACAGALAQMEQGAELVLLDLGAGVGKNVLALAAAADELVVVTTPEPTAIADAYSLVKVLGAKLPALRLHLVVNQAESEEEAQAVACRLQAVVERFLPATQLPSLGWVPKDPAVGRAVRQQRPFLEAQPLAPASRAVLRLSAELLGRPKPNEAQGLVARLLKAWRPA